MAGARAVVTNFFHGCVFSIINRRPFVAALSGYRTNKVQDLLDRLDLSDRLMTADAGAIDYGRGLSTPPGAATGQRLATLREASENFLDAALADL